MVNHYYNSCKRRVLLHLTSIYTCYEYASTPLNFGHNEREQAVVKPKLMARENSFMNLAPPNLTEGQNKNIFTSPKCLKNQKKQDCNCWVFLLSVLPCLGVSSTERFTWRCHNTGVVPKDSVRGI